MSTITNAIAEVFLGGLLSLLDEQKNRLNTFAFDRTEANMQRCIEINKEIDAFRSELKNKGY